MANSITGTRMNGDMTDEELMNKIERAVSKKTAHKTSKKRKNKKKEYAEELFKRLMVEDLVKKGYIKNF